MTKLEKLEQKTTDNKNLQKSEKMLEVKSVLDKILGEDVIDIEGTNLNVHLKTETDHDRFLELEIKETVILNVLYHKYNWEIKSEHIGFCTTWEDDIWGVIDLTDFVN